VDSRTTVLLDPDWAVGGRAHGGYLMRLVVEAALTPGHPDPLAVSATFVRSPAPGTAALEVEVLRTGRRVASTRVRLAQDGQAVVEALVTTGTLAAPEPFWTDAVLPDVAPLEECSRTPADRADQLRVGHLEHVELRLDPSSFAVPSAAPVPTRPASGPGGSAAEARGWLRRADGADASPLDLLVFADALPPVTFGLGLTGWVPTVELTAYLRALPAPGWVRGVQRARLMQDGWLDEDVELWDSTGRLVCQARQLAGYRLD